jgi:hypothetical protein
MPQPDRTDSMKNRWKVPMNVNESLMTSKDVLLDKVAGPIVTSENLQENCRDICRNTLWWPEKLGSLNSWMMG